MLFKRLLQVLAFSSITFVPLSQAGLILAMDLGGDGLFEQVIYDNNIVVPGSHLGPGTSPDTNLTPDITMFNGSIGGFGVVVSVGIGHDVGGASTLSVVTINNLFGQAPSDILDFWLINTDITAPTGEWKATGTIEGNTDGSVDAMAWTVDPTNTTLGIGGFNIPDGGAFGPGPFSFSDSIGGVSLGSPFSTIQHVRVTHSTFAQVSSFDSSIRVSSVPVPATLGLLFLGLGVLSIRRR